jgi:hypothetical protein
VDEDGEAAGVHAPELRHPPPPRQRAQQPWSQEHEQRRRHDHRAPVRHARRRTPPFWCSGNSLCLLLRSQPSFAFTTGQAQAGWHRTGKKAGASRTRSVACGPGARARNVVALRAVEDSTGAEKQKNNKSRAEPPASQIGSERPTRDPTAPEDDDEADQRRAGGPRQPAAR